MNLSSENIQAHAGAKFFCEEMVLRAIVGDSFRILVAGCGRGEEASYIVDRLNCRVDAIDKWLHRGYKLPERDWLHFQEADILDLPYDAAHFDAIFYHHVIEHIPDPEKSIKELARVLAPEGILFIGTPNRHRIIGNLGAHGKSMRGRLRSLRKDWALRLKGQFRNELGAHAGFSQMELEEMLKGSFGHIEWATKNYLRFKYKSGLRGVVARSVTAGPWIHLSAASIYAFCSQT